MAKEDWDDVPRTFRDLSWGLQTIVVVSFLAAGACIFLGISMDSQQWWRESPFLVNLASSAAVAFFGFPLGLVLVKAISVRQDERIERLSAYRLALASAKDLRERATRLERGNLTTDALKDLLKRAEASVNWSRDLLIDESDRGTSQKEKEDQLAYASALVTESEDAFREFGPTNDDDRSVLELEDAWRYWDRSIRPRLLSAGVDWVTNKADVPGRSLRWTNLFEGTQKITLNMWPQVENFGQGRRPLETIVEDLERIEKQLRPRQKSVDYIIALANFACDLVAAIESHEEADVINGRQRAKV